VTDRVGTQLVTVASCQLALTVGEPASNRAAALAAVAEAAGASARVIVLPELTPSGYVFEDPDEARSLAEAPDGPTGTQWAELAARLQIVLIGGFCELAADGQVYNSAMLLDPSGLRAVYRKAHLWDSEADFFVPGDQPPPVVQTALGAISMMICYDVEFPEWVRLPALAGAELLAVPTNWPSEPVPQGERSILTANVQVAAFANRMFVAAACRCGDERGVSWTGGSVIAGPDGYPLAGPASAASDPGGARPATLIAECDLRQARDKATGPRNNAHADRRADLYS
jgi:predicted amidohydrolase